MSDMTSKVQATQEAFGAPYDVRLAFTRADMNDATDDLVYVQLDVHARVAIDLHGMERPDEMLVGYIKGELIDRLQREINKADRARYM